MEAISNSEEETEELAAKLAARLKTGDNVCLYGELGAGKTCFARGIVSSLHNGLGTPVKSPTYTLLNIYEGDPPIYHFDFYRIDNNDEIMELGLDEYWGGDGICIVEWPKGFCAALPGRTIDVIIDFTENMKRKIKVNIPEDA
ncbi:MAG: tRNA (adenosine(37)-N6)-threonylcarbamoyltransferase complex ATPase subunit type 1 TsaE [Nitrospinota bacterium]